MRPLLLCTLLAFLVVSCRKDLNTNNIGSDYVRQIQLALKDSMSGDDFLNLDFSNTVITDPDSSINLLRIPLNNVKLSEQFVLLQTTSKGNILSGFIIKLDKSTSTNEKRYQYNGTITKSFLNRSNRTVSNIANGYIIATRETTVNQRGLVVPGATGKVLPDVVVTTYISPTEGMSFSSLMNLYTFFGNNGGGVSAYYSYLDGSGSPDGSNGDNNGSGDSRDRGRDTYEPERDYPLLIDFEPAEDLSAINIESYLKCFGNVADAGADCSIEIHTDIPVDKNPNTFFNWETTSPGHVFLQIKKTNGSKSVMQNIGFYPVEGWKTILTPAPVKAKFVDNGKHEYNAALKMSLTPEQLNRVLTHISNISRSVKYDIDEYNCTDFALEIFNLSRPSNWLEIPKYNIPGGMAPGGSNTPQGLYNRLKQMQYGPEGANITIPGVKGWVAESNGPCN